VRAATSVVLRLNPHPTHETKARRVGAPARSKESSKERAQLTQVAVVRANREIGVPRLLRRLIVLLGRGILLRWQVATGDCAVGICCGAAAEGVGDWYTEPATGCAAGGAAHLLLHCGGGVFEGVPDEFPVNVFFSAVVELQRAGVLGAGDSCEEAAENGAVHGAGGFQQGHGGEGCWVNGEATGGEAGHGLTVP
jgi:hypothetical protein